jgi:hypothetical protein
MEASKSASALPTPAVELEGAGSPGTRQPHPVAWFVVNEGLPAPPPLPPRPPPASTTGGALSALVVASGTGVVSGACASIDGASAVGVASPDDVSAVASGTGRFVSLATSAPASRPVASLPASGAPLSIGPPVSGMFPPPFRRRR